jgi:hypothetical protein
MFPSTTPEVPRTRTCPAREVINLLHSVELKPAALPFFAADDDLSMAPPEGFEPPTPALGRRRSFH